MVHSDGVYFPRISAALLYWIRSLLNLSSSRSGIGRERSGKHGHPISSPGTCLWSQSRRKPPKLPTKNTARAAAKYRVVRSSADPVVGCKRFVVVEPPSRYALLLSTVLTLNAEPRLPRIVINRQWWGQLQRTRRAFPLVWVVVTAVRSSARDIRKCGSHPVTHWAISLTRNPHCCWTQRDPFHLTAMGKAGRSHPVRWISQGTLEFSPDIR